MWNTSKTFAAPAAKNFGAPAVKTSGASAAKSFGASAAVDARAPAAGNAQPFGSDLANFSLSSGVTPTTLRTISLLASPPFVTLAEMKPTRTR